MKSLDSRFTELVELMEFSASAEERAWGVELARANKYSLGQPKAAEHVPQELVVRFASDRPEIFVPKNGNTLVEWWQGGIRGYRCFAHAVKTDTGARMRMAMLVNKRLLIPPVEMIVAVTERALFTFGTWQKGTLPSKDTMRMFFAAHGAIVMVNLAIEAGELPLNSGQLGVIQGGHA
ncbi:MAG: hypothetical protein VKK97_04065 [Synechococcaceae cyanobacterium]|nr:hypothetical protein [Synechococcaceae cyanobacterium]